MTNKDVKKEDVTIVYKFVDGAHFFTSTHPLARGLCAASTDLQEAYEDVPKQLKTLLKYNHGEADAIVAHAVPFKVFVEQLMSAITSALKVRGKPDHRQRAVGVRPPASAVVVRVSELEDA